MSEGSIYYGSDNNGVESTKRIKEIQSEISKLNKEIEELMGREKKEKEDELIRIGDAIRCSKCNLFIEKYSKYPKYVNEFPPNDGLCFDCRKKLEYIERLEKFKKKIYEKLIGSTLEKIDNIELDSINDITFRKGNFLTEISFGYDCNTGIEVWLNEKCGDPECECCGESLVDRGYGYPVCPSTPWKH